MGGATVQVYTLTPSGHGLRVSMLGDLSQAGVIIDSIAAVPLAGEGTDTLPAEVATAVQDAVAAQAGLEASAVSLVSSTSVQWRNACLGLAQEDEMCAQAITSGYLVIAEADGEQYEVHTNESGGAVRIAAS